MGIPWGSTWLSPSRLELTKLTSVASHTTVKVGTRGMRKTGGKMRIVATDCRAEGRHAPAELVETRMGWPKS